LGYLTFPKQPISVDGDTSGLLKFAESSPGIMPAMVRVGFRDTHFW